MSIFETPVTSKKAHPYNDDFNVDKLFVMNLFKGGLAPQGRELNQLQTILQNQIGRFADHFFKNASPVSGVNCAISNTEDGEKKIILAPGIFYLGRRFILVENFEDENEGRFSIDLDNGVLEWLLPAESTLSTSITSSSTSLVLSDVSDFSSSGVLRVENELIAYTALNTNTKTFSGLTRGYLGTTAVAHTSTTEVYQVEQRSGKKLDKTTNHTYSFNNISSASYSESPSTDSDYSTWFNKNNFQAGLKLVEEIITSKTDTSLLDNNKGGKNASAPGADRLKIILTLDFRPLNQEYPDFFSLIKYQNGQIIEQKVEPQYSEILEYLNRTVREVSGDFSVSPHSITITEWSDLEEYSVPSRVGTYAINVGSGVTYVNGARRETLATKKIELDRGLDNKSGLFVGTPVSFKNYDSFTFTKSSTGILFENKVFSITANATTYFAFVRGIEKASGANAFRVYFSDAQPGFYTNFSIATGATFYNSDSITSPGSAQATGTALSAIEFNDGKVSVYKAMKDSVDFQNLSLYKKWYESTALSGSPATLDSFLTGEVSPSDSTLYTLASTTPGTDVFVIETVTGTVYTTGFSLSGGSGSNQIVWSITPPSNPYRVYFKAQSAGADTLISERTELRNTTTTITMSAPSGSSSSDIDQIFSPDVYDVYDITSVTYSGTTYIKNVDYVLIDGQTPNYFYKSGIKWKKNKNRPTGTYSVTYKHWSHQGSSSTEASGSFICADSFKTSDGLSSDYDNISFYRSLSENIRRSDIIDFRTRNNQVTIVSNVYTTGDSAANGLDLRKRTRKPVHGIDFSYSNKRYLPNAHALFIDKDGKFVLLDGEPSVNPVRPRVPSNGLLLANFFVPPYARSVDEIRIEKWESKRYNQNDIRRIDDRVSNLETFTLNSRTENFALGLKLGPGDTRRGIMGDDFVGHGVADPANPEYDAAIDPVGGFLRLPFEFEFFDMSFNDPESIGSNIKINDKTVTLSYVDDPYIENNKASGTFNVNPFQVFTWIGTLKLTPSLDVWVDTDKQPIIVNDSGLGNSNFDRDTPVTGWNNQFNFWNTHIGGIRTDIVPNKDRLDGKIPLTVTDAQVRGSLNVSETTVFVEQELRKSGVSVNTKVSGFEVNKTVEFTVNTVNSTLLFNQNHDLVTAQKVVFNTDGTLPGGLSAGTTYYFIYVSPNRGKIASSLTNAEAGTAVTLTTVGKGTHTIQKLAQ